MDLLDCVKAVGKNVGKFVVVTSLFVEKVGVVTAYLNGSMTWDE